MRLRRRWHESCWLFLFTIVISDSRIGESTIEHAGDTTVAQLRFSHSNRILIFVVESIHVLFLRSILETKFRTLNQVIYSHLTNVYIY